ncbi:uncharacterized membrane protein YkvA (DUF1232 family) [Bacillus pakistanensis]|uniref:Uncharacterized membrane protein YkvA (DUF1232 family) n=1 Tax=Rossellomorea pakistanensis TaxID=992288 RepID=A0ABS2N8E4_9BACI|nr:DUF1232 domain-containing protein [Bacillus pakistanensis]MBM7584098.1 uncharacterized membrane protein YkvA (DUF1232 family) [Bacillus pakistanensis]
MSKFLKRIRFLFNIRKSIPFLIAFFKSKEVNFSKKILSIGLLAVYIIVPLDIIPDYLILFGIVDDLAVFALIFQQIVKMAPEELKRRYDLFK